MKKSTIIFLTAIAVISCKKDPIPILTVGNTSGLIVTNHDIKLETDTAAGIFYQSATVDLDQDDKYELNFEIRESISPHYVGDRPYYSVEFYVANYDEYDRRLILPEIAGSADWYVQTETIYDTFGTFQRETLQEIFTCNPVSGATLGSIFGGADEAGAVEIYTSGSDVLSLPETASENIRYSLLSEDYQYEYWEFNATSDSLIGYRKIKEAQCAGKAPFNQLFYIPFKLVYDDSNLIDRTGWIELRLTENNTLEIIRSAISSN